MRRRSYGAPRQGIVLPETPNERREKVALQEDLRSIALTGERLPLRLRHFRPSAEEYLASAGGPRPYMLRLRTIEEQVAEHEEALDGAWHVLAAECDGDAPLFARRWRSFAGDVEFDEVNELIDRHNRWYPIESNLAMDPRTGDYVLVNGRDYRLLPLDAGWVLDRYPPVLERARPA